jgi:hypothetical protein
VEGIYACTSSLLKKWKCNDAVHQPFMDFKRAYDSVRMEVLYNRVWGTHETRQVDLNVFKLNI